MAISGVRSTFCRFDAKITVIYYTNLKLCLLVLASSCVPSLSMPCNTVYYYESCLKALMSKSYGTCKDYIRNNLTVDLFGICEMADCEDKVELYLYIRNITGESRDVFSQNVST